MILTCPDCATRYSVKDGSIGPNGRTVRCASCNATWFVSQEADELALAELQASEIERIDDVISPPSAPSVNEDYSAFQDTHTDHIGTDSQTDAPALGAHVQFRDKVDRKRRNRRLMGVSMIWVVTLGLLGTAGTLGYAFRQPIVEQNPSASWFYDLFNISVTAEGLDFEDPATRHVIVDGRPVLVVNGMIINRDKKTRQIPMIELSFLNGSGETIAKWLVEPSQAELGPRKRLEYVSQYPNPPVDAAELFYRFVDDAVLNSETSASLQSLDGE